MHYLPFSSQRPLSGPHRPGGNVFGVYSLYSLNYYRLHLSNRNIEFLLISIVTPLETFTTREFFLKNSVEKLSLLRIWTLIFRKSLKSHDYQIVLKNFHCTEGWSYLKILSINFHKKNYLAFRFVISNNWIPLMRNLRLFLKIWLKITTSIWDTRMMSVVQDYFFTII